jgi:hypothetical protein
MWLFHHVTLFFVVFHTPYSICLLFLCDTLRVSCVLGVCVLCVNTPRCHSNTEGIIPMWNDVWPSITIHGRMFMMSYNLISLLPNSAISK